MSQTPRDLNFGLSDKDWNILETVAINPLKSAGGQVWIFGSRARGSHREFSDVDLLYSLKNPTTGLLGKIAMELEESNLAVKVDLVAESELASSYRDNVMRDRVQI